jgi:hypothetical protein
MKIVRSERCLVGQYNHFIFGKQRQVAFLVFIIRHLLKYTFLAFDKNNTKVPMLDTVVNKESILTPGRNGLKIILKEFVNYFSHPINCFQ